MGNNFGETCVVGFLFNRDRMTKYAKITKYEYYNGVTFTLILTHALQMLRTH